jgi:RNA polymerase sigma-70 factor (ECF subfamily)
LFGIAFRIALAYRRKHAREVPLGLIEATDFAPGVDDTLYSKQARAIVAAALDQMPLRRRVELVMHDFNDIPVREVAATLEIPLFTVYSRLRKQRQQLQALVRQMLTGEGST